MNGFSANDCQAAMRFVIERRIGAGGMGTVYRAFDRQRNQWVALKTLPRLDPEAIYRFKREFRTLAEVVHPNLVCLHELIAEEGRWFFTMEFVEGVDFLEYVRLGVRDTVSRRIPDGPPDASFPATLSLSEWFASEGTSGATDGRENETTRQATANGPDVSAATGGLRTGQLLRLRPGGRRTFRILRSCGSGRSRRFARSWRAWAIAGRSSWRSMTSNGAIWTVWPCCTTCFDRPIRRCSC
jgi:hypothetical protein